MADKTEAVLAKQIVYDGEDYSRGGLENLVTSYATKHQGNLETLDELSRAHDALGKEMTAEIVENKSAWEHLGDIVKLNNVGANIQGLLEKIPVLRAMVPERPLHVLLTEKLELAQRRTQEVGNYVDRIGVEVAALQEDIARLNRKMVVAARNEEAAASHVLELKAALEEVEAQLARAERGAAATRELEARRDALTHRIWEHGARLRLYSTAEDRLSGIIRMNNNFLEILRNLHGNMQTLYEAGNEVLSELEGNLAALASAAKASELSIDMRAAMESLRGSVNKVAVLASETSLFLTQNVDRLTREMRVYDQATEALVEANLAIERETREHRINDTVELAQRELAAIDRAKAP
jgi:hypothetical protein